MKTRICLASVGVFAAMVVAFLTSTSFRCWMDHGNTILGPLCSSEDQTGNFCTQICASVNQDCYLFHGSKTLVRRVVANGVKMVLKHKTLAFLNDEYVDSLLTFDDDADLSTAFQSQLRDLVTFGMHDNSTTNLLKLLWPWQDAEELFDGPNWPALRQILLLSHNDEYRLMQLHGALHVFPAVLGTCGDVYAVEHVSILLDGPLAEVLPAFTAACHAARSVGRILRFLRRLAAALPAGLHLCDLKWAHFGAAADGRLRFVDLDAAFWPAQVAATQEATPCRADVDCDFFDCRGACDAARGRCRPRLSDNVSNLCRRLAGPAPLPGLRLGLLAASLEAVEVALLERCADGGGPDLADQVQRLLDAVEARVCGAAA